MMADHAAWKDSTSRPSGPKPFDCARSASLSRSAHRGRLSPGSRSRPARTSSSPVSTACRTDAIGPRIVAQSLGGFTAPLVRDRVPVELLVLIAPMIPAPGEAPAAFLSRVALERLGIVPDEIDGGHTPALSRPRELTDRLERYTATFPRASTRKRSTGHVAQPPRPAENQAIRPPRSPGRSRSTV
jgi:hypothetical protein